MYRLQKYSVVLIVIIMIFLANTVNTSFIPKTLAENRDLLSLSNAKDTRTSMTRQTESADAVSVMRARASQESKRQFPNPFEPSSLFPDSPIDKVEKASSSFSDPSPTAIVIGLDNDRPSAYGEVISDISNVQGSIVNTVSIESKVIAVVADVPSTFVTLFQAEVRTKGITRYVEPRVRYQADFEPNDPYWGYQWGPKKIMANWAWNTTTGDHQVLVAIIDTGIDYYHPDLAGNYVPLGRDWVNSDEDPLDDNGHGTHCAGIIAGIMNNGIGITGVANVSIMSEKGLDADGYGWDDELANAIIHAADQGAKVLSNSWGGDSESELIHDAVKHAYSKGVLVVAAAGNSASSTKHYPAAYDEVVGVTATDSSDLPAYFTSYGDWVELAAPGASIFSTLPTYHVTLNDRGYNLNYDYLSGTSMACPHVAGLAALTWSLFPNRTRDWLRLRLRYTADDLGLPGLDPYYGYGRINAEKSVKQAPPDHDMLISGYEKPAHVQPGDSVLLNASLINFGSYDEQNVTVQLLVDGSLTDSKVISYVENGSTSLVGFPWGPLIERTYNVTFYMLPVFGETDTANNVLTAMISVRTIRGFVLFEQTRCEPIDYFSTWVQNLTARGYVVDTYSSGSITLEKLVGYDVLVIPQAMLPYSPDEIAAVEDFVSMGGGLLAVGDYYPQFYSSLTSFAGITWNGYYGWSGYTSYIILHNVTAGVNAAFFYDPNSVLSVASPAQGIVFDGIGRGDIMLAASEAGAGRVIALADKNTVDDSYILMADNRILANNMIDWLMGMTYQHDLAVRIDAPRYLEPGENSVLNATVYNVGLDNETDVELELLINDAVVGNATIANLANGTSYTMSYSWTPTSIATYNVTAYAPPVPNENITANNARSKLVGVHHPLISPIVGQYANYTMSYYDTAGQLTGIGCWNLTYDHYVEPHMIYVKILTVDPSGYNNTAWMIVNAMNRYVETGIWAGMWYPGWIENNVSIGSTINLLDGNHTINGSSILEVNGQGVDCWEISFEYGGAPYTMWYDKLSGLWIGMEATSPYDATRIKLLLDQTNVPIHAFYEHELGVALDAPLTLQPGETWSLRARAYNLGANSETNVEMKIWINDVEVANATIGNVYNGTWHDQIGRASCRERV